MDRFEALLEQGIARGFSQGRAGVFLSGGFDSVSVAAMAADLARRRDRPAPVTLSVGFPDPSCDERGVQTSVAQTLGLPRRLLDFHEAAGPRGLLAEGLTLNERLPAPLLNVWFPVYVSLLRQAQRDGVTTIFTGEGGDEWLGATPFLAADLIARGDVRGLVRVARTWHRSYRQTWPTVIRGTIWEFGLRPLAGAACARIAPRRWDERRTRRALASDPAWLSRDPSLRRQQHARLRAAVAPARPIGGFYRRETTLFLDHPLHSWLFEEQQQVGAAFGVRYAHPYLGSRSGQPSLPRPPRTAGRERPVEGPGPPDALRGDSPRSGSNVSARSKRSTSSRPCCAVRPRRSADSVADFRGLAALEVVDPRAARTFVQGAWTPARAAHGRRLESRQHGALGAPPARRDRRDKTRRPVVNSMLQGKDWHPMSTPRPSGTTASPRPKWERPTVTRVGSLTSVLGSGDNKVTVTVGDPGEPRKLPGGDK